MSREEFIGKLEMVYVGDRNAFNDIVCAYDSLLSKNEKAVEYNNRLIKDTKDFYRPITDTIYSGDCIIDIAKNNINILQNGSENDD